MFSRVFGDKKSYETELIDGVEVGRPVIDSASISGQSFGSSRSSKSSRRGSPEHFPNLVPGNRDNHKKTRRRPAPLQTTSLGFNEQTDSGNHGIWTPVRRSGAVRHQVNPLTRRCQTLPDVHHNIIDSSRGREDEPRSASERSYGGDDTKDVMSVDLSSFVPPPSVHHGPGPSTPVRRGAIRRGDNPLTSRRDALQENNPSKGSGSGSGSRHRGPPPTSLSDSSSFPVRRGAVRRSEIPLTSSDTFQGNGSDKYYQESSSHRSHGSSSRPPPTGGSSGVVFPVRRGATRSSENPLTSRRNTFQGNDYAPDTSSRDSQPQPDPYKNARTIEHPDFVNPTIICPQPRRNVIPNFGRDLGMAWFTDPRESDEETDPEDYSPRGSEEYAVLRPGPERKVQIVRPGLVTGEQEASSPGSQSRRDATANANEHQPPFKGHIYENPDWSQLMSPSSQRRMALDVMSEWDGVKGRGPFL